MGHQFSTHGSTVTFVFNKKKKKNGIEIFDLHWKSKRLMFTKMMAPEEILDLISYSIHRVFCQIIEPAFPFSHFI